MNFSSKPISSPSRTEKFPPPLTRFLRSNGGNRSRGRSRSSPMFVRKKNAVVETQEPTSPKVTCIGQVRVRRSKQAANKTGRTSTTTKRRCWWIRKALFCNRLTVKPKPWSFRPVWRRWCVFFQVGYRKKVEILEESKKRESKREETEDEEEDPEEQGEEAKVFDAFSPPKNALLLMRCKSAPYRSSSLANRFWSSPSATEEVEQNPTEQKNRENIKNEEDERPTSEKEPIYRDSAAESRTDPEIEEKFGFCEGFESSSSEKTSTKTSKIEDETSTTEAGSVHPLILMRCKSEPARRSGKLDPETCFWKKRRMGFVEQRPPHVL